MKKILFLYLVIGLSTGLLAQDYQAVSDTYSEFARRKGAFAITLSKDMIDAVDLDIELDEQIKNVNGDIYEMRIILFSEDDNGTGIVRSLNTRILKAGYPQIKVDLDTDNEMRFCRLYGKKIRGIYHNIHLVIQDSDGRAYFLTIKGRFTVNNLL